MSLQSLRQYLSINRKRLGPGNADCGNPRLLEAYKANIRAIAQADALSHAFFKEMHSGQRERFSYQVLSLGACVLMFAFSFIVLFVFSRTSGYSFRQSDFSLGRWGWILYLFPLGYLWLRAWFLKPPVHYLLLMTLIIGLCAYLGGYRGTTLFGSELNWLYVAMAACTLVTLCYRVSKWLKIAQNTRLYKRNAAKLNEANQLVEQTLEMHAHLGDAQAALLLQQFSGAQLEPRTPWFNIHRDYDQKNGNFINPHLRTIPTTFSKPFENSSEKTDFGTVTRDAFRIVEQQFLGYETLTAAQLHALLQSGKVFPFYNWGLPYLPEELHYRMLRHSWKIRVSSFYSGYRERVEQRDSKEQIEFDINMMDVEALYLGKTVDHYLTEAHDPSDDFFLEEYQKKKAKKREDIGYDHVTVRTEVQNKHEYTEEGNEIGVITARTKDGELLGMYCGNSRQAIEAAYRILNKETGFTFSESLSSNGDTQAAYLYRMYIGTHKTL